MSDLLLNWLNDDIQLSQRITNFEEDFHNGYLFGELLAKYSQQLNFPEFVNKDDKSSRINNFSLLLETFTALRITFDSNLAMKIINKNFGIARKVLYQLKTQLEKTNTVNNAFSKSTKMTKALSPLKKIQISKQKYDQVGRQHFLKQLNELHPAQKEIVQQKMLKKFGDFHQKSIVRALGKQLKQKQIDLLSRNKFRQQQIDNLKKSEEFRKQWQSQNAQKWAMNMSIRQTQVQKDQFYRSKFANDKMHNKTMAELNAVKALDNDIAKFQKKNQLKKIDSSDEDEDENKYKQQPSNNTKLSDKLLKKSQIQIRSGSDNKIGDSPSKKKRVPAALDEKSKHQREKRRRKMIVQQNKRYQMIEITRRERYIVSTIEQTSKQEKQIQYEIWRAWQNKDVIIQNKSLTEEKQKEKQQTRAINAQFKKQELLKVYREEHSKQVEETVSRFDKLQVNNRIGQRKQVYGKCKDIINDLVDITEKLYEFGQDKNTESIDEGYINALLQIFVDDIEGKEEAAQLQLKNYIEGKGQWSIKWQRTDPQASEDPVEDNALPTKVVNNFYLGNILKTLFEALYQQKQNNRVSQEQKDGRFIISLLGLEFAGKRQIAEELKSKFSFNIIQVSALIQKRMAQFVQISSKNIETSQQTTQLVDLCLRGEPIPEQLIICLLKEELSRNPKSVLIDYPTTYEQAIELTREFGGVQPYDYLGKSKLSKKIQQFSRLVKPTPAKQVQMKRRQCGVDVALWVQISLKSSIDRFIGRRWIDGETVVHLSDENVSQHVNNLSVGQKGSSLIMKNNLKINQLQKVKDWFNLFGVKIESAGQNQGQEAVWPCWQVINGSKKLQELKAQAIKFFQSAIQIKQKTLADHQNKKKLSTQLKKAQEEQQKSKLELKQKCVFSSDQLVMSELQKALSTAKFETQFLQKESDLWNKIQSCTIASFMRTFIKLRQQEEAKNKHISSLKKSYISLLTRQDQKFHLVKRFQAAYNKFYDQNIDMISYDYTKQQLHQRIQDLENDLLSIVEEKREDALAQRASVMSSGWLDSQFNILYECIYVLVQTQLTRYSGSEKIINDFYSKKYMISQKQQPNATFELNVEAFAVLEPIKDNTFPKLDKIIVEAFRIFNKEEQIIQDKNKKGGKAPPPAKKDDKKGAKKGGKDQVEQKQEPKQQEIQLKKAVNTQKAIFRYRINVLKAFAGKKISQIFQTGQKLYKDLQDLYQYTYQVQNRSIFNLTKIFKKAIEQQCKIENEVQICNVSIIETQRIRNYEKQKPIILPAKEEIASDRFTIANILELMNLIKNEGEGLSKISTKRLVTLLNKLTDNEQLRSLLPQNWKNLQQRDWEKMVKLLDNQQQGYIQLAKVFMFIIFSNFKIPTAAQIEQYALQLTNYSSVKEVPVQKFTSLPAWFDSPSQQKQSTCFVRLDIRTFNRDFHIKSILFSVLKRSSEQTMEISKYLHVITLQQYAQIKQIPKNGELTYFQYAFK